MTGATVLVTDARRGSAIAIVRSLGRRGYRVVAADSDRRSPGFYSRYVAARVHYPDPRRFPDAAVETLVAAAHDHGVDLLVPVTDDVILALVRAPERFAGVSALALPHPEALARAWDKRSTLALARTLGIPVPRTEVAREVEEAIAAARTLGWPVVVKPRFSRRLDADGRVAAFGVTYAADEAMLVAELRRLEGRCEALLQEYVPGEGHGVELLLRDGRPLAAFQHRRLREVPYTGGASSFRESVPLNAILLDHAVRLLEALRWTGLAMVEFRIGPDGPRLMEVNGRVWGSLPLAVRSGVDFPALLADLHLGAANGGPRSDGYRVGVRSRNVELELAWIGSVLLGRRPYPFLPTPRRREALAAAVRLLRPADGFDVLSPRDPLPGLAGALRIAARAPRKLLR
jgi:predicted ATP-grasp superfamily ATP-dependent carboligase